MLKTSLNGLPIRIGKAPNQTYLAVRERHKKQSKVRRRMQARLVPIQQRAVCWGQHVRRLRRHNTNDDIWPVAVIIPGGEHDGWPGLG